jgi:hypothetical protein
MPFSPDWYQQRLTAALAIDTERRAAIDARFGAIADADEAWEQCAPRPWDTRDFLFSRLDDHLAPRPETARQVRAFCANPEAIERAECLARETLARRVAGDAAVDQPVRWRFWPRDLWLLGALPPQWLVNGPWLAPETALVKDVAIPPAVLRAIEASAREQTLFSLALGCARWDASGRARNPFEPLVELCATGAVLMSPSPLTLAIPD